MSESPDTQAEALGVIETEFVKRAWPTRDPITNETVGWYLPAGHGGYHSCTRYITPPTPGDADE